MGFNSLNYYDGDLRMLKTYQLPHLLLFSAAFPCFVAEERDVLS